MSHLVGDLATSPGHQYLVAYSPADSTASLLSEEGTCREIKLAKPIDGLCLSVDSTGNRVAFAYTEDHRLRVRHLDSGREEVVQSVIHSTRRFHACSGQTMLKRIARTSARGTMVATLMIVVSSPAPRKGGCFSFSLGRSEY